MIGVLFSHALPLCVLEATGDDDQAEHSEGKQAEGGSTVWGEGG